MHLQFQLANVKMKMVKCQRITREMDKLVNEIHKVSLFNNFAEFTARLEHKFKLAAVLGLCDHIDNHEHSDSLILKHLYNRFKKCKSFKN